MMEFLCAAVGVEFASLVFCRALDHNRRHMYRGGWDRREMAIEPDGYAMFGYGMWHHRARGRQTALYARAICLVDDGGRALFFCCLDLGYASQRVDPLMQAHARIAWFQRSVPSWDVGLDAVVRAAQRRRLANCPRVSAS